MIKAIVQLLFTIYMLALLIRIAGSYIPELNHASWMNYIAEVTDPYLNLCRRYTPLLGTSIDLSPLVAFLSLYIARIILVAIL